MRITRRSGPLAFLLVGTGCIAMNEPEPEPGTGPIVMPPEARWVVRTAVGRGELADPGSGGVADDVRGGGGHRPDCVQHRGRRVWWRRTDVPSRAPIIVNDTLVVTFVAGESAGLRSSNGQLRWRTRVAEAATSIQPVRVGRCGIVAGFDGEVSSVDLYTGATRLLGTGDTLLGNPRTRANGFAVTGDTLYVIGQQQPAQVGGTTLGPVLITRVDPVSGAVLARHTVPARTRDYLGPFRATIHGPLLVLPTGGSVVVIDRATWAVRWRDSSANVGDPGIRGGRIYTGNGVGEVVVRELATGALVRRVRTNTATINALFPCRDGIYFASGALWRIPPTAIARARSTPAKSSREWCGLRGRCTATRRMSRWHCGVREASGDSRRSIGKAITTWPCRPSAQDSSCVTASSESQGVV